MGTKNKKIAIIVSILLVAGSLGYLAFGNFGENIVYFVTPSEVKAFTAEAYTKKVRVGGMVDPVRQGCGLRRACRRAGADRGEPGLPVEAARGSA